MHIAAISEAFFEDQPYLAQAENMRRPRLDIRAPNYPQNRLPLLSAKVLHTFAETEALPQEDFNRCLYQTSVQALKHSSGDRIPTYPSEYVCDKGIIVSVFAAARPHHLHLQDVKWESIYIDDLRDILRATIQWATVVHAYRPQNDARGTLPWPFQTMTLQVLRSGIMQGFITIEKGNKRRKLSLVREPLKVRPGVSSERAAAAWSSAPSHGSAGATPSKGNPESSQEEPNTVTGMQSARGSKRVRPDGHGGSLLVSPGTGHYPSQPDPSQPGQRSSPQSELHRHNGQSLPHDETQLQSGIVPPEPQHDGPSPATAIAMDQEHPGVGPAEFDEGLIHWLEDNLPSYDPE